MQILEQSYIIPLWKLNKLPMLNPWVSRVLTFGIIMTTAYFFWWTPIEVDRETAFLFQRALGMYYNAGADVVVKAVHTYAPMLGLKL